MIPTVSSSGGSGSEVGDYEPEWGYGVGDEPVSYWPTLWHNALLI